jgi:hypothetical protein
MSDILKNIGNVQQFTKEELTNAIAVLGIGYFGACITVVSNLSDNDLDILLPDNVRAPPYVASPNQPPGMLNYFFSIKSEFPHHITSDLDFLNEYLLFYGGVSGYVFSSYRSIIKYIVKLLDNKNPLLDMFSFYLLPIIITYFVLFPFGIPLISGLMSIIPCIYQDGLGINALLISWAFITNWFDGGLLRNLFELQLLPMNFVFWIGNGLLGVAVSMFLLVVIGLTCFSSWIYMILLWFLMPIFLKLILGISFNDLGKIISSEIKKHLLGLITLFSLYTISSAYKFLNSQVALGITIGSITILSILFYNTFKVLFDSGFLKGLSELFVRFNIGPTIFWLLIIFIVVSKYTSTQKSISTIY